MCVCVFERGKGKVVRKLWVSFRGTVHLAQYDRWPFQRLFHWDQVHNEECSLSCHPDGSNATQQIFVFERFWSICIGMFFFFVDSNLEFEMNNELINTCEVKRDKHIQGERVVLQNVSRPFCSSYDLWLFLARFFSPRPVLKVGSTTGAWKKDDCKVVFCLVSILSKKEPLQQKCPFESSSIVRIDLRWLDWQV